MECEVAVAKIERGAIVEIPADAPLDTVENFQHVCERDVLKMSGFGEKAEIRCFDTGEDRNIFDASFA